MLPYTKHVPLYLPSQLKDSGERALTLDSEAKRLQAQVIRLTPFEPKYTAAEAERTDLAERLVLLEGAYRESKASVKHLGEAQGHLKEELEKVIATNHSLMVQVKTLSVLKHVSQ